MANKPPAFLYYPSEFDAGTSSMKLDGVGLYTRLLNAEWNRGPLPNDHEKLAIICRVSIEVFEKVWADEVQDKFISNGNGCLVNERMEKERAKQEHRRELGEAFGKKGGGNPNFRKGEPNPYHKDKGTDKGVDKGTDKLSNSISNSKKDTNSLHAPRPIAQTAQEIEKLNFVLRLHDPEFSKWMNDVLMLIGEENRNRPHNPFKWNPTCGSIASDFKKLIYSPPDEEKKKLLYESYNILNGNMNWPEYVKLAIQIMLKASDKKPIHSPYGFVAKLLYKPGDIVSAAVDGPMASLKGRE